MTKAAVFAPVDGKTLAYSGDFKASRGKGAGVFVTLHKSTRGPSSYGRFAVWKRVGAEYALVYEWPEDPDAEASLGETIVEPTVFRINGLDLLRLSKIRYATHGDSSSDDRVFLIEGGAVRRIPFNPQSACSEYEPLLKNGESIYKTCDLSFPTVNGDFRFGLNAKDVDDYWADRPTAGAVVGKFVLKGDIGRPASLSIVVDTSSYKRD